MRDPNITNLRGYGDTVRLLIDNRNIAEAINAQGLNWLADAIATNLVENCNKFNLSNVERDRVINSFIQDLKEAFSERT